MRTLYLWFLQRLKKINILFWRKKISNMSSEFEFNFCPLWSFVVAWSLYFFAVTKHRRIRNMSTKISHCCSFAFAVDFFGLMTHTGLINAQNVENRVISNSIHIFQFSYSIIFEWSNSTKIFHDSKNFMHFFKKEFCSVDLVDCSIFYNVSFSLCELLKNVNYLVWASISIWF